MTTTIARWASFVALGGLLVSGATMAADVPGGNRGLCGPGPAGACSAPTDPSGDFSVLSGGLASAPGPRPVLLAMRPAGGLAGAQPIPSTRWPLRVPPGGDGGTGVTTGSPADPPTDHSPAGPNGPVAPAGAVAPRQPLAGVAAAISRALGTAEANASAAVTAVAWTAGAATDMTVKMADGTVTAADGIVTVAGQLTATTVATVLAPAGPVPVLVGTAGGAAALLLTSF
jgi:hypothetical protein